MLTWADRRYQVRCRRYARAHIVYATTDTVCRCNVYMWYDTRTNVNHRVGYLDTRYFPFFRMFLLLLLQQCFATRPSFDQMVDRAHFITYLLNSSTIFIPRKFPGDRGQQTTQEISVGVPKTGLFAACPEG